MMMLRKKKLVAVLAGGGALALGVLAWRKRKVIGETAEDVVEAASSVSEKAKEVVQKFVASVGKIPQAAINNFQKYGITDLIEKHRGSFPWNVAAAFVEIESKGDPKAENKSGAAGVVQILGGKNSRGLSKEERLDADKSLEVILPEWRRFLQQTKDAGVSDPVEQWAYVYLGHNQGAGVLKAVLPYASEGFSSAVKHYRNYSWVKPPASEDSAKHEAAVDKHIERVISVARTAAGHAVEWATLESKMKDGQISAALGSFVVDNGGWTKAPIYDRNGKITGFAQVR